MIERIEQLKDKKCAKAFMLLSAEERKELINVGRKNRSVLGPDGWKDDYDNVIGGNRIHLTFIIRPEYQPEPECVDYLIEICVDPDYEDEQFLGVKQRLDNSPTLIPDYTCLYQLPCLTNFVCFWQGEQYKDTEIISHELVAAAIRGGQKVHVRLERPKNHDKSICEKDQHDAARG